MTADNFRRLALALPEASESAHMGHPDFRVRNKVFATLSYPGEGWAMVKLTPQQQASFVEAEPAVFAPVKGGWGRRGATNVHLKAAREASVRRALLTAWCEVAPKRLVKEFAASL
ncbi:MAG TPA: MmcQ/YjbR family DNA-binding protein [Terriglobia bacterium]|nr:MmcQ/YjbR family DNA-binding protein [Terriglobia bacterium]